MDGEHITGLRTAAGAALSTRALAREDASVLAIVGSGVQARAHLRLLPLVRDFAEVRVVARDPARRRAASSPSHAAPSPAPRRRHRALVAHRAPRRAPPRRARPTRRRRGHRRRRGRHLPHHLVVGARPAASRMSRPGTHVTSVGFAPPGGELDPALAAAGAAVRRDPPGVRPASGGLRRARGPGPGVGDRARRAARRPRERPLLARRDHRLQGDGPRRRGRRGRRARLPRARSSGASGAPWTSEPSLVVVGHAPPRRLACDLSPRRTRLGLRCRPRSSPCRTPSREGCAWGGR